jgi:hypothetical protein
LSQRFDTMQQSMPTKYELDARLAQWTATVSDAKASVERLLDMLQGGSGGGAGPWR